MKPPRPPIEISSQAFAPGPFLRTYWQRRPLVIRGLFRDWRDNWTANDYAGLACEKTVVSRLVMTEGPAQKWSVTSGPQSPARLRRLPHSHWTLLVEGVDSARPTVARMRQRFSFLPRWRFDDIMVSVAPVFGSVGAHIDSYDVFLVQGEGTRRWELDVSGTPSYRPGLDLRVLKKFAATPGLSFMLERGDVLYVPPGLAHRGTTTSEGLALTYSIGFRAPRVGSLVTLAATRAIERTRDRLLSDAGRRVSKNTLMISTADAELARKAVLLEMSSLPPREWAAILRSASSQKPMVRGARRASRRKTRRR